MGKFSVRYYRVEKEHVAGPSLLEAFVNLAQVEPIENREVNIAGGMRVRLERFEDENGEFSGEFTRVQMTDFPFEIGPDGVSPLTTEGYIGDGVAFRFRQIDHTLVMQYDARICSPGRAIGYLKQQNPRCCFLIQTKFDQDNWTKFEDGNIRDFTLKIASPDHLPNIENEALAAGQAFDELGAAYGAPFITIKFGMGQKRGYLSNAIKSIASQFRSAEERGDLDIKTLRAKVAEDEGIPPEDINLIDQIFSNSCDIDYPQNDPERNYNLRKAELQRFLNDHQG